MRFPVSGTAEHEDPHWSCFGASAQSGDQGFADYGHARRRIGCEFAGKIGPLRYDGCIGAAEPSLVQKFDNVFDHIRSILVGAVRLRMRLNCVRYRGSANCLSWRTSLDGVSSA